MQKQAEPTPAKTVVRVPEERIVHTLVNKLWLSDEALFNEISNTPVDEPSLDELHKRAFTCVKLSLIKYKGYGAEERERIIRGIVAYIQAERHDAAPQTLPSAPASGNTPERRGTPGAKQPTRGVATNASNGPRKTPRAPSMRQLAQINDTPETPAVITRATSQTIRSKGAPKTVPPRSKGGDQHRIEEALHTLFVSDPKLKELLEGGVLSVGDKKVQEAIDSIQLEQPKKAKANLKRAFQELAGRYTRETLLTEERAKTTVTPTTADAKDAPPKATATKNPTVEREVPAPPLIPDDLMQKIKKAEDRLKEDVTPETPASSVMEEKTARAMNYFANLPKP